MTQLLAYVIIAFVAGIFFGLVIGTVAHSEDLYKFEQTLKASKAYYERTIGNLRTELSALKHEMEEKEHARTRLHRDDGHEPADWW